MPDVNHPQPDGRPQSVRAFNSPTCILSCCDLVYMLFALARSSANITVYYELLLG